jgi:hypothetical protein
MKSNVAEHLSSGPSSPSITSVSDMASSESFEDLSPGPTNLPNKTAIDSSNVKEHDVFFWQDGMTTIRVRYDMVIFSSF